MTAVAILISLLAIWHHTVLHGAQHEIGFGWFLCQIQVR